MLPDLRHNILASAGPRALPSVLSLGQILCLRSCSAQGIIYYLYYTHSISHPITKNLHHSSRCHGNFCQCVTLLVNHHPHLHCMLLIFNITRSYRKSASFIQVSWHFLPMCFVACESSSAFALHITHIQHHMQLQKICIFHPGVMVCSAKAYCQRASNCARHTRLPRM